MISYLYRWKLQPGKEEQFIQAWAYVTAQLREKSGSLGSRLHRGDDGFWYGYAQWPSVEARRLSKLSDPRITEARKLMRNATDQVLPDVVLTPVCDFLRLSSLIEEESHCPKSGL